MSGLNAEALAGFQPPSVETDKIELRSQNLATLAMELQPIQSLEDFKKSRDLGDAIRAERTLIAQTFNGLIAWFHGGHKAAIAKRDKYDKPLEAGEARLGRIQGQYILAEKEKERRAAAERDRIEAEKRAAEEKALRLAQEAEQRAREEAEAKRQAAEREARAREAAAAAQGQAEKFKQMRIAEEEARIKEAKAKAEAEAKAEADRILAAAATAETKIVEEKPAAYDPGLGTGLAARRNFKWNMINAELLPHEFWMPDETKIGEYVRKTKTEGLVLNGAVWSFIDPGTQRTGR